MATGSYTTHAKVRRLSGHEKVIVVGESIGTGDASNKIFYVSNFPIIDQSGDEVADKTDVTVYVSGVSVTITSISADEGKITLDAAPGNGTPVTADYWYSDVSETAIADSILYGEAELEDLTGQEFTNANSKTDYFDGDSKEKVFILRKYPIQTITSVKIRDPGQTSWTTQTLADGDGADDDYWKYITDGDSYIEFVIAPTLGHQNVEIIYTYGYSSVPEMVDELAACLAALYIHIVVDSGWSISSYRLVEQEVSFGGGSPHGEAMNQLKKRISYLLSLIGRRKFIGVI